MSMAAGPAKLRLLCIVNRVPYMLERAEISEYGFQVFVIHIAQVAPGHDGI
jgi:hypothetical protein